MLAEIASGNADTADVFFLLAAIVFGLVVLVELLVGVTARRADTTAPRTTVVPLLVRALGIPLGLLFVSIAWLVL